MNAQVTVSAKITKVKCLNFWVNTRIEKYADCATTFGANGTIYQTWTSANGKPCAAGTSFKMKRDSFNYSFSSVQQRDEYVAKCKENAAKRVAEKKTRREEGKAKRADVVKNLAEGDVLYTSWGYDQTNVDFYQVVSIKGKKVQVKKISRSYNETGFMSGNSRPRLNKFVDDNVINVGLTQCGGFKIEGHYAWIHKTGETHYTSSYA